MQGFVEGGRTLDIITAQNLTLNSANCVASGDPNYPYSADVLINGSTPAYRPMVDMTSAPAGLISPKCWASNGFVRFWTANNTFGTVMIDEIQLIR